MLEAVGTCLPISPRKRRLLHLPQLGHSFPTTPSKPHVERLLEQSNDVEANPGPLPHRLVRAHSGALVKERGGLRQMEVRSREQQEVDRGLATLPPGPHVARLLEQANDIECNPGPLPHRLVSRVPTAATTQQARGRVNLSMLSNTVIPINIFTTVHTN